MQKHASEITDVEWVPPDPSHILVRMGHSYLLDFLHSFIGEKGTSEKEWDPTMWSGLKHHYALAMSSVLLMEIESLSVT